MKVKYPKKPKSTWIEIWKDYWRINVDLVCLSKIAILTYYTHKTDFKLLAAIWNLTQIKSNNRNTGNDDDDINNFENIIDKLSRWFRLYRYLLVVVVID